MDDFDRIADWQPDAPPVPRDREVDTTAAIPPGTARIINFAARLVDIHLDVPGDRAAIGAAVEQAAAAEAAQVLSGEPTVNHIATTHTVVEAAELSAGLRPAAAADTDLVVAAAAYVPAVIPTPGGAIHTL